MGVQWGYKARFWHKKNPATVEITGHKKAAPTGFEFLSAGDTLLYHVSKPLKNKGFLKPMFPHVILCYTVVGVQWGYKGGTG